MHATVTTTAARSLYSGVSLRQGYDTYVSDPRTCLHVAAKGSARPHASVSPKPDGIEKLAFTRHAACHEFSAVNNESGEECAGVHLAGRIRFLSP